MQPAPTKEAILNDILLGLADTYEAGNIRPFMIEPDPDHPEEFEPLRECLAELVSEGWLVQPIRGIRAYNLTHDGYRHFRAKIQAVRTLGKA
ncbi:MAG TPA: hypothetical protein VEG64_16940 [Candidatus Sulfotelmatobacter sp.]|nr:hypothetical protein [Candidatus Sulfotelmatobacter sp.]